MSLFYESLQLAVILEIYVTCEGKTAIPSPTLTDRCTLVETYHCIPTVGGGSSTPANDLLNASLVYRCIAL